jgi:ParB family chromosome partitioning protein
MLEKNQKNVLGKGLASLLNSSNTELSQNKLSPEIGDLSQPALINISKIKVNQYQPRKIFKEKDLVELSESIKENGIIQPLIVTQVGNEFELIAGERRLRAAKLAGLDQVPVVVKRATDREKFVMAIIENVQRSELNCVEEALAYFQLIEDFKLTQEEVAKKIGKERSTIANFLRILKLPRDVVALLQKEQLSFGHAKVLASIKEDELVKRLALEASEKKLSVRELELLISKKPKQIRETKDSTQFERKLEPLKKKIEDKTGFHVKIAGKKNGSGKMTIIFNNEAELNDIFEYLMK